MRPCTPYLIFSASKPIVRSFSAGARSTYKLSAPIQPVLDVIKVAFRQITGRATSVLDCTAPPILSAQGVRNGPQAGIHIQRRQLGEEVMPQPFDELDEL